MVTAVFSGDYESVVGTEKDKFLEECTASISSQGVTCVDVRPGSLVIDFSGQEGAVGTVVTSIASAGQLQLPSFTPVEYDRTMTTTKAHQEAASTTTAASAAVTSSVGLRGSTKTITTTEDVLLVAQPLGDGARGHSIAAAGFGTASVVMVACALVVAWKFKSQAEGSNGQKKAKDRSPKKTKVHPEPAPCITVIVKPAVQPQPEPAPIAVAVPAQAPERTPDFGSPEKEYKKRYTCESPMHVVGTPVHDPRSPISPGAPWACAAASFMSNARALTRPRHEPAPCRTVFVAPFTAPPVPPSPFSPFVLSRPGGPNLLSPSHPSSASKLLRAHNRLCIESP